jgi:hypothetical protein
MELRPSKGAATVEQAALPLIIHDCQVHYNKETVVMQANLLPARSPFTLFDLARVQGGAIVVTHDNWCKALESGRAEDCRCGDVEYKIVRKGARQR